MKTQFLFLALALSALTGAGAWAQTIAGRVVDSNGIGVPNVDIDVESNGGGGDPDVSQDFTDANGNFVTTVTPAGIYDIVFTPPSPPVTTHLRTRLEARAVVGATNLGTIALPPGYSISGRVLNTNGLPVNNVDLDVKNADTGVTLETANDTTNALGNFIFAVPRNTPLNLELDPRTVPLVTYAPRQFDLAPTGNTNLGNIVLQPGFHLSGALRSSGLPVVGADIDVDLVGTNQELFLHDDITSGTGAFSVIVPAGNFTVRFCPKVGDLIVAGTSAPISVNADLDLGFPVLFPGVVLSGHVNDVHGAPAANVDVEVVRLPNQIITLCRDDTNASGDYQVIVPTGSLAVQFRHSTLGTDTHIGVNVAGNTVLNGQLSPLSAEVRNGANVNELRYANVTLPRLGSTWTTSVDCSGTGNGFAVQIGRTQPLLNGPILAQGQVLIRGSLLFSVSKPHTAGGTVSFSFPIPADLSFAGQAVFTQAMITGTPGTGLTNAIDIVLGP